MSDKEKELKKIREENERRRREQIIREREEKIQRGRITDTRPEKDD